MSEQDNMHHIPGVPQPVPAELVTDLADGSMVEADIYDPQQKNWYRFEVVDTRAVTITFQGPASEYTICHYKTSDEKGGTGNAHEERSEDVVTYTFAKPGPYTIFLSVASADPNNWSSSGYIIRMSVASPG
jgi:PKD repeat protein